jgi:hypothetical protein
LEFRAAFHAFVDALRHPTKLPLSPPLRAAPVFGR